MDDLPFLPADGGYQFIYGPQTTAWEIMNEFDFVDSNNDFAADSDIVEILEDNNPWYDARKKNIIHTQ